MAQPRFSEYEAPAKAFASGVYGGVMDFIRYPGLAANYGFEKFGLRTPEEAQKAYSQINAFADNPLGNDWSKEREAYPGLYQAGNFASGLATGQLVFKGITTPAKMMKMGMPSIPYSSLGKAGKIGGVPQMPIKNLNRIGKFSNPKSAGNQMLSQQELNQIGSKGALGVSSFKEGIVEPIVDSAMRDRYNSGSAPVAMPKERRQ